MFLDRLSRDEQRVYCQLAYAVMAADGEIAEKEMLFYERSIRGLTITELPDAPDADGVLVPEGAFRLSASRRLLMVELALLVVADGVIADEEVAILDAVAEQLELTSSDVQRFLEYATRLRDVVDEGFMLLAEVD